MSRWFRHYAGMMSDPKFGGVARRCKRSRAEVLFVWGCLLESAAEQNSAGYEFDADSVADLLAIESEEAQAIHDALVEKGLLADGRIVSWDARQFTSDNSTERSRKSRERRRGGDAAPCNDDATLQQRRATPPETETETETEDLSLSGRERAREQARSDLRRMQDEAAEAAGDALASMAVAPGIATIAPLVALMAADPPCDWQLDVLPAISAAAAWHRARAGPGQMSSWTTAAKMARENRDRRLTNLPTPVVTLGSPHERSDRPVPRQSGREAGRAVWAEIAAREAAAGSGG